MKRKIIVTVLFALAIKFNVIAAEKVENEKKTAESVFAIAKQMEIFDADVLKAEMKGLGSHPFSGERCSLRTPCLIL